MKTEREAASFTVMFWESLDSSTAKMITYSVAILFVYLLVAVPLALFTNPGRNRIRLLVLSGLAATLIISLASGVLYIWHHYYRS